MARTGGYTGDQNLSEIKKNNFCYFVTRCDNVDVKAYQLVFLS